MLQERVELEALRIKTARDLQEWLQLLRGGWGIQSWRIPAGTKRLFTHLDGTKYVTSSMFTHFCRLN